MEGMAEILAVTFPFFALVLAGYLATRWRWLPIESIAGLNTFVLYFALPCLLYRFGSSTPIAQLLDVPLFLVYLLCALLMVGFVVTVTRNSRIGWNDAAFGALVAAFPNTGFMGVPLLVALLGAASAGPAIVSIVVDLLFTASLCIALSRLDGADEHGAGRAAKQALKGVMINPMPWAIVLGAITSAQQVKWPGPVDKTLGLLADAASPVALFTIGAVLARSALHALSSDSGTVPKSMPLRDYVPIAFIKLLVHPVLVLLVGTTAMHWGVRIDPFALMVVTLVAALPSASNVAVLSEKFGADTGRIARIILLSTAAAFLTFSGFVAVLRG
jgi:predicted permease